jgi:tetratricopeptide (TPR) repeat protein
MTESLLRGRFDREAEEQISFLMERYPESPSVLIQKAILSHRKGDFAAATEEANAVLRNGSAVERARADVLLGLMAVARDDMNAALEYAEAAIRFGAPIASPYLLRGSIRFNQLKYVAAEADFTRAIRLEPELEDGYEWRARTLQSKDLFREAIRDYTEAIRLSSTPEKMAMRHLHRAMCYIELQTWEYARIDLDRAREISPGLPEILFVQGRLAAAQGNWQEGLDALNRYLRVRQDPLAVQWRDRCLQALGRKGPAQTSSIQKVEPDATTPTTAREDIVFQAIPVPMAPSGAGRNDTAAPEVGSNSSGTSPLDHLLAMTTPEALRKIEANEVEEPSENRVAPASNQESTVAPSTPSQEEKPPASSQPEASSAQSPDSSSSQIDMSLEDLRDAARQNPGNLEIILAWVRAEKDRANGDPTSLKEANNRLLELLQADPQPSASDALLLEAWKECIERTTQLGGPQRGIIVNQTALQQFPEDTDLHLSFAKLAAHLGRIAETADSLKFVLEQEPNHIEARLLEVQWLQLQNDPDAVEAKFEELLNLAPKNPTLFQLLARYRASQKDWDRTLDACNNAISLGNDTPEIHRLRASAFSAKGDESKALEELARAAWLAPDSEETIMLRASILMEHSRFDWAFDSLAKFVEDHPDSYAPILRLCQIGWTLPNRRHKVMREWLPLAIERFPEKPGLHALQAQVFLDLNMPKEAIVAASEAVRTGPDNAANWHLLGRLKGADGQFEDARECLEQAVSIDPSLADAWSDLGAVLLQLDETEEAMLLLEKATDVQPDNPLNYYRFGLALMKGQQFARAASAFSTVRELKPEWAAAWSQNISAEIQAGNQAKAEELRAAAKQKFPGENWDAIR